MKTESSDKSSTWVSWTGLTEGYKNLDGLIAKLRNCLSNFQLDPATHIQAGECKLEDRLGGAGKDLCCSGVLQSTFVRIASLHIPVFAACSPMIWAAVKCLLTNPERVTRNRN